MTQRPTACLVFKTASGQIACGGAGVSIELIGDGLDGSTAELVREAATGVLHYFRVELGRESVSVGEFSTALAKVLRGFGLDIESAVRIEGGEAAAEVDLMHLVRDAGGTFELGFYRQLREEMVRRLAPRPRVLRFTGLRCCVKKLRGVQRWSARCEALSDQIVAYVRQCLSEQPQADNCAVVVL